ncbi:MULTISPECIES: flagellar biosynthesis protein FlhB [Rubrivivax]|uniref:Flagellar biosynthetic protein FlhB n=1 Tax=Rubrivivax benzoatilyticus TaxID=316997 RepID=A0ABX0HZ95_9BURK|nr:MULTISPECIES: flagellar biosynthesis protein FlhB [Rubrivivax]EGJ11555.1 flagellar biosynthesis protein [Rubrivivax benzoatilyticus JA2 = ATCC BAA-35]NHK99888.1 flagellar biosynthesis protein FlhB [Rubrivivax benzoatilyticus]NHL25833.1 flagellar biosynthesis protein FlhB [Rubrivivax benzoatilyticus]
MADDAQDRRLPASQRKISKSREDGQVARSQDLGHLATLGAGLALLIVFAPRLTDWLRRVLETGLRFDAQAMDRPGTMLERLSASGVDMLVVVLPLGAVVAVVAAASAVLAGGWNWTFKPMQPKFSKLNPITGLGNLFKGQQLVNTLKICLLALILGAIGMLYLHAQLAEFTSLVAMPLPTAMAETGSLLQGGMVLLLLALTLFALVDVPLQRFMLLRRLRMSFEEVKQEHKESEGNPEVKGKIKAKMREMARRKMMAAVPSADLVVMNPTHFAVALKYDEATMAAPRVVAKGADLLAFRIRDAAKAANVPVLEAPPLARALYRHAEIDQEIPAALFGAVAQVLAWVYQLRAAMAAGRPLNAPAPAVAVPPGFDPAEGRAASGRTEP